MKMLIDRQVLILQSIVENFITTNQPVGSKQLAENIDFSSATIRNDMSKLDTVTHRVDIGLQIGLQLDENFIVKNH